jgi:CII-binding regulator of phage lambda lysogenization HflD
MNLPNQNATYIQQLNQNIINLEASLAIVRSRCEEVNRDLAALQRAVIEFLKEKKVIEGQEDLRLLQKLHMQNIALIDQQLADHQNKQNPD